MKPVRNALTLALALILVGSCRTVTGPDMDCYVEAANLTCYDADGDPTPCWIPHCDCVSDSEIQAALEADEPPFCVWEPAKGDVAPDWWQWENGGDR